MKRFVAALLLATACMIGIAAPAFAHNVLISSDPRQGSSVETSPHEVTLTFDLPIQNGDFDVVTITGPGGTRWEAGTATVRSNVISAPVRTLGPAGDYTIGYRILSADGHPVSGAVTFTLTKAGNGTPASVTVRPPGQSGADSVPTWIWIAGGVALLVAGVMVAIRFGRKVDGP